MKRRTFLASSVATLTASELAAAGSFKQKMGLTIWSYGQRWRNRGQARESWKDALDVLEHCDSLGAGCLQIGVGGWSNDFSGKVRDRRESLGIALEGQVGLPEDKADLPRFQSDLEASREAGGTILRAVCLSGRRYENMRTVAQWKEFQENSLYRLQLAEPILRKARCKLALENHKDWRADEHLALMKKLDSEWIGVTLDFGNNFSLLDHPHRVAEMLAPYVLTTHFKDMAMAPYEDGFLLSEVPVGNGQLDLASMVATCRKHNPGIWFNLEMITRDPLKVPVYKDQYWVTFPDLPARDLADTLRIAKVNDPSSLPRIQHLDTAGRIAFEEENVRKSFAYGKEKLGFA